ncbi:MAG: hypothetical protein QM537_05810 [Candidatus Symbiobacter sp.]|nr:hypothetical protein [Candidatus Symbiobacter sp.]
MSNRNVKSFIGRNPLPIMPTDAEDAAINRGIAADPENPELDAAWFAAARPASEVLPPAFFAKLTAGSPHAA